MIFHTAILACLLLQSDGPGTSAEAWLKDHPSAMSMYSTKCIEMTASLLNDGVDRANAISEKGKVELERVSKAPISPNKKAVKKNGLTVVFANKESKAAAIKAAEKMADEAIGILKSVEIYSKETALVPLNSTAVDSMGAVSKIRVLQIANENEARVSFDKSDDDIWLECSTAKYVDGKTYSLKEPKIAIIIGTKRYTTAAGSLRTIPHAVLVPAPKFDEKKNE